jgi:phosphatidylglycerophosphatase A
MAQSSIASKLATLGGLGRFPYAPGTMASIVAGIPAACLLGVLAKPLSAVILSAIVALSCFAAGKAESQSSKHDPREIVIDELAGYLVTMIWFPITAKSLILGLAAFRIFDILKPWPVSVVDLRVKGGFGVVLDDVAAGIYAHALLWILLTVWR